MHSGVGPAGEAHDRQRAWMCLRRGIARIPTSQCLLVRCWCSTACLSGATVQLHARERPIRPPASSSVSLLSERCVIEGSAPYLNATILCQPNCCGTAKSRQRNQVCTLRLCRCHLPPCAVRPSAVLLHEPPHPLWRFLITNQDPVCAGS